MKYGPLLPLALNVWTASFLIKPQSPPFYAPPVWGGAPGLPRVTLAWKRYKFGTPLSAKRRDKTVTLGGALTSEHSDWLLGVFCPLKKVDSWKAADSPFLARENERASEGELKIEKGFTFWPGFPFMFFPVANQMLAWNKRLTFWPGFIFMFFPVSKKTGKYDRNFLIILTGTFLFHTCNATY